MKKIAFFVIPLSAIIAYANNTIANNSVIFVNLTNSDKLVKINYKNYKLPTDSSLRIVCVENEIVEFLYKNQFENLVCGSKKELK